MSQHFLMVRTDDIGSLPNFIADEKEVTRFVNAFESYEMTPPLRILAVRYSGKCRVYDERAANLLEAARRVGKIELMCAYI